MQSMHDAMSPLVQMVEQGNVVVYNNIAASVFLLWDYCITFSWEVDLVWKVIKLPQRAEWRCVSLLFFCSRYLACSMRIIQLFFYANITGLINPTPQACMNWLRLEVATFHLLAFAVDLLLAGRAYAAYGKDRKMLYLLVGILVSGQIAAIVYIIVVFPGFKVAVPPIPHNISVGVCIITATDPRFPLYAIPTMVVKSLLTVIFTVIIIRTKLGNKAKAKSSQLRVVFIRDGVWAYALLCSVLLWVCVAYKLNPQKGDIGIAWLYSVASFCTTRLILNLRLEAQRSQQHDLFIPIALPSNFTVAATSLSGKQIKSEDKICRLEAFLK